MRRGLRPGGRAIAFDPEEKIGRDENRLNADRETLGERTFFLLRLLNELDVRRQLARGDRPAERAAREVGHDAARAHRRVRAGQMAARVDLLQARARRPGRLRIRSADVERVDAHAVHRNLRELSLRIVERLAQLSDPLGRRVWRRLELARRRDRPRATDSDPL